MLAGQLPNPELMKMVQGLKQKGIASRNDLLTMTSIQKIKSGLPSINK
jgi:hypothetical protein